MTTATRIGGQPFRQAGLAGLFNQQEWMDDAACIGTDPEVFFPPSGRRGPSAARWAKRVCAGCPVATRAACLDYALSTDQTHGVWGGLSAGQRAKLKRSTR